MSQVVVIDYGMGNLKSVQRGLEVVGARVEVSSDTEKVATADRLVLPGVGSFRDGMAGLQQSKLDEAVVKFVSHERHLLGICLRMQMLMEKSEEFGVHQGLGIIPGSVRPIPEKGPGENRRKIPHIGWSFLSPSESRSDWSATALRQTRSDDYFYFVHSFMTLPTNSSHVIATCDYHDQAVTAAIGMDNVIGLQFHPEKSGACGLKIMQEFMNL